MNLVTIAQIAAPVLQTVFIVVIGLGYYYSIRATQTMVMEMREEHTAGGGRPLITVSEDYANLPNMNIIVQNVGLGPAKDITFEFSEPVQSSDGSVLSELPFFEEGKIASDITVTVRYKDLNLKPLEHEWDINPRLYEGIRNVDYSGITDLVDVAKKISERGIGQSNAKQGT